jgi:hypothetical protein
MAQIDTELAAALKQARKAPMSFAYVAKGAEGKLLVARKRPPAKEVAETKKEIGGGTVFRGRCVGEEGKLVFEVPKEPPATLAKQIKATISREAGMALQVEVRVAPDLAEEGEGDDVAPTSAPEEAQSKQVDDRPPVAPPSPDNAAATFKGRLKAVMPVYQQAVQASPQRRAELDPLAARAAAAAKTAQYLQGLAVLDQLEAASRAALQGASPVVEKPAPEDPRGAALKAAFAKLMEQARTVLAAAPQRKNDILTPLAQIKAGLDKQQFDQADAAIRQHKAFLDTLAAAPKAPDQSSVLAALDKLSPQIKQAIAAAPDKQVPLLKLVAKIKADTEAGRADMAQAALLKLQEVLPKPKPPGGPPGTAPSTSQRLAQGRLNWQNAKETAGIGITALQAALRQEPDPRFHRIAEYGLNGITGRLQVGLHVALLEYEQSGGQDAKARSKALNLVTSFRQFLTTDKMVPLCEENPFGVDVKLRDTLLPALDELEKSLQG